MRLLRVLLYIYFFTFLNDLYTIVSFRFKEKLPLTTSR